ncbi:hypothetical protein Herbaro_09305 [Herbaspirillum sp. WKF16]|uniref:hypothetical protein n=1 Tax=Herbaspirillum sp. WKF16 TaxID=3028312 RepID=UPI0023AA0006|nr:hypothetical protein [Herbaspirillum sp. WKF16]WDZ97957.1 hypothetical protein Herbaro_09305 [Herbaspirillum sp. WKF16]
MTRAKPYKPRLAKQPMMRTTVDDLALELRLGVEALIGAPSAETYNQLVLMTATLDNAGAKSESLTAAQAALTSICNRFDADPVVTVTAEEAESLRAAADGLDRALAKIPHNVFRAAQVLARRSFAAAQARA